MIEVVKALYNCSFTIWNTLMQIAMTLFTTSPKTAASGGPYSTVYTIYTSISDATIPIATVFFIIALYKTVISAPQEQQAQRFIMDGVRYCMILFLATNMWKIMGYIMTFADGITGKIGSTTGYTLSMSGDLETIIDSTLALPSFALSGEWFSSLWSVIGCSFLFLIGGIVLVFIMVASCISIISSAFQRILKPLIIMPFAGIAVALGAGGHDLVGRFLLDAEKTGSSDLAFDYFRESIDNRQLKVILSNLKTCSRYQANYEEVLAQMMGQIAASLSAREERKNILFSMKLTLIVISIASVIIVALIGKGIGVDIKGILTGNIIGQGILFVTGLLYLFVVVKLFGTDK